MTVSEKLERVKEEIRDVAAELNEMAGWTDPLYWRRLQASIKVIEQIIKEISNEN